MSISWALVINGAILLVMAIFVAAGADTGEDKSPGMRRGMKVTGAVLAIAGFGMIMTAVWVAALS